MSQRSAAASFESIASSSPLAEIVDSASMSSAERAIVKPAVLPITAARPVCANGSAGSGAGKDMLELCVDGEVEGVGQCRGVIENAVIARISAISASEIPWSRRPW